MKRAVVLAPKTASTTQTRRRSTECSMMMPRSRSYVTACLRRSEHQDTIEDYKKKLKGEDDAKKLSPVCNRPRDRYANMVKDPAIRSDKVGWSLVATTAALVELSVPNYGGQADITAALALAKEAAEKSPSSLTHGSLTLAHAHAAIEELARTDRALGNSWKSYRKSMSASDFLALYLERGGSTSEKIAANSHAQAMVKGLMETQQLFPKLLIWICGPA